MAVDKVRPLKIEEPGSGTETDMFPTEVDYSEDYLSSKGIVFENEDATRIFGDSEIMKFQDTEVTTVVTLKQLLESNASKLKELGFHDNSQPDVAISSSTYKKIASFIYSGSSIVGEFDTIKAILRTAGTSGDIKVFDATNAQTIAEKNFTNSVDAIVDLGTVSNIPSGAAIFEIQMKRTGGGSTYIASFQMGWDL